ncbi:hypothetical protein N4T77_08710 [Clostridium sp. CX1]|uniref:NADH-quinone oxidoreductase subunit B family protein n=1 Tax=Clostridium sp. CX1 TaxID=2978346 RepID=UPI0021C0360D|nr:hypothetical protein [Clostridium sp. CX1]MCT8976677.1 hypothetical protein [Clostridium sp. CX1]
MNMTRRNFLKWMIASGVAVGMGKIDFAKAEEIINNTQFVPVVWLQAAGCSGCTIAFLDMVENEVDTMYTVEDLLINKIDLKYHSTLMTASAAESMEILNAEYNNSGYILVVEGGIPTSQDGAYCIIGEKDDKPWTALQALKDFAANASSIIAIGTCSAYRGVSGAGDNITKVKAVDEILTEYGDKIINLPGCPVQPYIIGGTIAKLLAGETLAKDSRKRPKDFYAADSLHVRAASSATGKANCPLRTQQSGKATTLGTCGKCFENMGCRGRYDSEVKVTCYTKLWGMDWSCSKGCLGSGSICIGCSSPNFPYTTYTPDGVAAASSIYSFK